MAWHDDRAECDMERGCKSPVTHIDDHGFIYCEDHGRARRASGRLCRFMDTEERNAVRSGWALKSYYRKAGESNVSAVRGDGSVWNPIAHLFEPCATGGAS